MKKLLYMAILFALPIMVSGQRIHVNVGIGVNRGYRYYQRYNYYHPECGYYNPDPEPVIVAPDLVPPPPVYYYHRPYYGRPYYRRR